jgi:hypothetical protein
LFIVTKAVCSQHSTISRVANEDYEGTGIINLRFTMANAGVALSLTRAMLSTNSPVQLKDQAGIFKRRSLKSDSELTDLMQDFSEPRTFPNMDPRSMQQSDLTRYTFFHTGKRDREREATCSYAMKHPHYISETDENVDTCDVFI